MFSTLGMGEHQKVRVSSKHEHVVFRKVQVLSELKYLMVEHIRVRASMIEHPSGYRALRIGKIGDYIVRSLGVSLKF